MDSIMDYFGGGAKPVNQEKPMAIERTPSGTLKWVKELSPLANNVIGRCARILLVKPEDLQAQFDKEAPASAKETDKYALSLLEYCCFRALSVSAQVEEHLADNDFRRLTFDMMLAWEAPGSTNKNVPKVEEKAVKLKEAEKVAAALGADDDDEEDSALFYSDLMPMMAEVENTVGAEAFTRLAPAIPSVADIVTVHPLWEALTNTTGGRLPYPLYDTYFTELDKSIKSVKSKISPAIADKLRLEESETVIEIDGTATGQTVLLHEGTSTWPGRLTLTNYALYFEVAGVLSYGEARKFDLSKDLNHEINPDLTGPWGAKLFDKAIQFKSEELLDPIAFEFPEMTGHSRRDYWLALKKEIVGVHKYSRTYKLEGLGKSEALARAVLGIARLRAVREVFKVLPPGADCLLTFCYGDIMPHGDLVMAALADTLRHSGHGEGGDTFLDRHEGNKIFASSATASVASLGPDFTPRPTPEQVDPGASAPINEYEVGGETKLEKTIKDSRANTEKVEEAQATVDTVKVDGIGTNVQVLTELLKPLQMPILWAKYILSWENKLHSSAAAIISFLFIFLDLLTYIPAILVLTIALNIFYLRYMKKKEEVGVGEVLIPVPEGTSTVEALVAVQQGVYQAERTIQGANIALLKIRALLLSNYPEASNQLAALLAAIALGMAVIPVRWIAFILWANVFSSGMQSQRQSPSSNSAFHRRFNEWWYSIPVVPVRFLKPGEKENADKVD
ncbi:hypothetical protein KC19_9G136300 [Ceratodon purpureus]|uniref:Uncharacterized protein n=1 Tax=Ceratodon purpureus TaxID=3225 RepID=A0A8T0GVZ7_CERPU|nr:hypothetical protein KC19_9G136300 [Ceratodon purpureus]